MKHIDPSQAIYRKSTKSGDGNCVLVSDTYVSEDVILVRDSKDPDGPALSFTRAEWLAFVGGVTAGEFNL